MEFVSLMTKFNLYGSIAVFKDTENGYRYECECKDGRFHGKQTYYNAR